MSSDVPRSTKWKVRILAFGGLLLGLVLLASATRAGRDDAIGLYLIGIPITGLCGYMIVSALIFRFRYTTPEARAEQRAKLLDTSPGNPHAAAARSYFADRATRGKDEVLCSGVDGTAVVTFLADGHRGNEFKHLVYLELDVTVGDADTYQVRTGEYLTAASSGSVSPGRKLIVKVDPKDPQRVAVDWEWSLRLDR